MALDVLMINLPIKNELKDSMEEMKYNPSLGLLCLATSLEMHGYNSKVLDLCFDDVTEVDVIDIVAKEEPVLVGISTYTENIGMALKLSRRIKAVNKKVKIMLGGAHPSLRPEECIRSRHVDFLTRKEGEATIIELIEAIKSNEKVIKYEDITNLVFKRNKQIVKNNLSKPICDLNILPLISREQSDFERYGYIVNVSTSRGCPANCIYCSATALSGASYRTRSVESIFMEMVYLKATMGEKLQEIYIIDDTFTVDTNRVKIFAELMKNNNPGIEWHCESRIDVMSEELLKTMSEANCKSLQYGIESGSQYVLDMIKKDISLKKAREIIKMSSKYDIQTHLSFITGHYCDDKNTMKETYDFMKEMYEKYGANTVLSFNTPFPGTWQYTHREKLGMNLISEKYEDYTLIDPIVETENFTIQDQKDMYFKTFEFKN